MKLSLIYYELIILILFFSNYFNYNLFKNILIFSELYLLKSTDLNFFIIINLIFFIFFLFIKKFFKDSTLLKFILFTFLHFILYILIIYNGFLYFFDCKSYLSSYYEYWIDLKNLEIIQNISKKNECCGFFKNNELENLKCNLNNSKSCLKILYKNLNINFKKIGINLIGISFGILIIIFFLYQIEFKFKINLIEEI